MNKNHRKILVVDDSPISQKITQKFLETSGYEVFEAWDGKECFEKVEKEKPDAILMDVILPDINGKDIVKQLQNDPLTKDIPVIFATNTLDLNIDDGNASIEVEGRIYRAFAKPIHSKKLLSVIRKEINRRRSGGQLPEKVISKKAKPQVN